MSTVGFLPAKDRRVTGTIAAIEKELTQALLVGVFCTLCLASAAISLLVAPEVLAAVRWLRECRRVRSPGARA